MSQGLDKSHLYPSRAGSSHPIMEHSANKSHTRLLSPECLGWAPESRWRGHIMRGCCSGCCCSFRYLEVLSPQRMERTGKQRMFLSAKASSRPTSSAFSLPFSLVDRRWMQSCQDASGRVWQSSFWTKPSLATVVICHIKVDGGKGMQNEANTAIMLPLYRRLLKAWMSSLRLH